MPARDFPSLIEVPGFSTPEMLRDLYDAVADSPLEGHCLEIGSWSGQSAICFAWALQDRGFRDEKLYCVDPFTSDLDYESELRRKHEKIHGPCEEQFRHWTKRFGVEDWIRLIVKPSRAAAEAGDVPFIRFAFVDGDHTYEGVSHDIGWCLSLMPDGGQIALDDFGSWGTPQAAAELLEPRFKRAWAHPSNNGPRVVAYDVRSASDG